MSRLLLAIVALRVIIAAGLVFGPWLDAPEELAGWDSARFQEIADSEGDPYVDFEVEYPPGTVVAIKAIAQDDVVNTTRVLVLSSLLVDLGLAAILAWRWRREAAVTYLLLGLPLLPAGLLRFDLWAALAATVAAAALVRSPPGTDGAASSRGRTTTGASAVFAAATVVGALIKIWPVFLVPAAYGTRDRRPAIAATALGAIAGLVWITVSGADAISQVTSLRGATGWHLESIPGSLASLFTDAEPRKEADAFRIGTLRPWIVAVGRLVALVVVLSLTVLARRRPPHSTGDVALVMLGSVSTMLVTAPLLSPQFLLWLTPWAAIVSFSRHRTLVLAVAAAITLTGGTLAAFGPPDLDHPIAATLLLLRDGLLAAVVVLTFRALTPARPQWSAESA